jgi:hypothetical protein
LTSEESPSSSDDHLIDGMSIILSWKKHFHFTYSLFPLLTVKQYDAQSAVHSAMLDMFDVFDSDNTSDKVL